MRVEQSLVSAISELAWFHLDAPRVGDAARGSVELVGWACGRDAPLTHILVRVNGTVCGRGEISQSRPDLVALISHAPWAANAGFRVTVPACGGNSFALSLHATGPGQRDVHIADVVVGATAAEPLVSVVVPCYGQGHFLMDALRSSAAQTHPAIELIAVNDGSYDNAAAVARTMPGATLIDQENRGLSAARNAGLAAASGEYIVFLDSDDRLLPQAVELAVTSLVEHSDAVLALGHHRYIDGVGAIVDRPSPPCAGSVPPRDLLLANRIEVPASVTFRTALVRDVGGFAQDLRSCEDWDMYLRMAALGEFHCHHNVVAEYRQHGGGMSRNAGRMLEAWGQVARRNRQGWTEDDRDVERRSLQAGREFYGRRLRTQLVERLHDHALRDAARVAYELARLDRGGLREVVRLREPSLARAKRPPKAH